MVTVDLEIRLLRRREDEQQQQAAEADRLIRDLLSIYKCDFIVVDLPPQFSYAFLDGDWRNNNGTCRPMRYRLDRGYKGPIAISLPRLRELHKRAIFDEIIKTGFIKRALS
jgi:hypothetical protein